MIIPVQCFTCGKLIADKWTKYKDILDTHKHNNIQPADGETSEFVALKELGVKRYCCKRMFLSQVDLVEITT